MYFTASHHVPYTLVPDFPDDLIPRQDIKLHSSCYGIFPGLPNTDNVPCSIRSIQTPPVFGERHRGWGAGWWRRHTQGQTRHCRFASLALCIGQNSLNNMIDSIQYILKAGLQKFCFQQPDQHHCIRFQLLIFYVGSNKQ